METEKKKKSRNGEESSSIPHDIVFDILTRLPVKSLSRFRCVSKLWNSTISDGHFVKAHHNRTLTRSDGTGTTLLITILDKDGFSRSIYTADYYGENPQDSASVATAVHHLTMFNGGGRVGMSVSHSLNGLIYLQLQNSMVRICNPITREFITFPCPIIRETTLSPQIASRDHHSFGYDPINNQYKVLKTWVIHSSSSDLSYKFVAEHHVFVLGAHSWRRIGDCPQYFPYDKSVCVSGTVYYRAWVPIQRLSLVLVAFDVRLETFRYLQLPDISLDLLNTVLIPYNGIVAIVDCEFLTNVGEIVMHIWVLEEEDSLKPSWVHKIIVSPFDCTEIGEDHGFRVAGINLAGEIILAPTSLLKPFCVFYLNVNSRSVRRVHIHNMPDQVMCFVGDVTASDHMENILSLTNLKF